MTIDTIDTIVAAFETSPLCFLATCTAGEPNVVPVGFRWIEDGRLLIADLFFGRTRDNLAANPRVAVAVGLLNPKRGFQVKASARVHREGPVFDRVAALLAQAGVAATPAAALEIPLDEVYILDPGANAGKQVR